jgi:type IV pilus assembly protein PilA
LVELLVVVAMVGILSALAVVGYRKYVAAAGSAEAMAMMQLIRHGETQYKSDAYQYLGCSGCGSGGCSPGAGSLSAYYPMATPSHNKYSWEQPGHSDYACWRQLNVRTDGAVRFGYAVVAGNPADAIVQPSSDFKKLGTLPQPKDPWFVIQAAGDSNDDGLQALAVATSTGISFYIENDTE